MKGILIILSLIVWVPISGLAQDPSQLFQVAREANPELKAINQAYYAAREKAPQVSQLPDPRVGLGLFILPVETRLGSQRIAVNALQVLPWFGTLRAKEDWANSKAREQYQQLAIKELDVLHGIKLNYYELYRLKATRSILEDHARLFQTLKSLTETSVSIGDASLADVLRVEIKLKAIQQKLNILPVKERKYLAQLNYILNRPPGSLVSVQDSLPFASLLTKKDTLLAHIRDNHPLIRLYELQQESARKAIAINDKAGKPAFGIGGTYALINPRTDANPQFNGRDIFQVQGSLSIPLNRKVYQAKEREEHFKIEMLENMKEASITSFMALVEGAYSDHEQAVLDYQLYEEQITLLRTTITILETDYSNQGADFGELLRLKSDLLDKQLMQLDAIARSYIAQANLERFLIY